MMRFVAGFRPAEQISVNFWAVKPPVECDRKKIESINHKKRLSVTNNGNGCGTQIQLIEASLLQRNLSWSCHSSALFTRGCVHVPPSRLLHAPSCPSRLPPPMRWVIVEAKSVPRVATTQQQPAPEASGAARNPSLPVSADRMTQTERAAAAIAEFARHRDATGRMSPADEEFWLGFHPLKS